ncbi:hypothetical protein BDN67DRAFT_529051 [Paxillus ammoniavirescens]|nr:hypothetical protein BDN67DRAFT_529051 [Paxillus ammoniavirescens]
MLWTSSKRFFEAAGGGEVRLTEDIAWLTAIESSWSYSEFKWSSDDLSLSGIPAMKPSKILMTSSKSNLLLGNIRSTVKLTPLFYNLENFFEVWGNFFDEMTLLWVNQERELGINSADEISQFVVRPLGHETPIEVEPIGNMFLPHRPIVRDDDADKDVKKGFDVVG